jgi:hypothetical protein
MMEAIWKESGISCEVLTGGPIEVGGAVEILAEKGWVDDGKQPPGYYVPPSTPTIEWWWGQSKWRMKKKLLEIDPEGIVEASYGTVRLTFWLRDKDTWSRLEVSLGKIDSTWYLHIVERHFPRGTRTHDRGSELQTLLREKIDSSRYLLVLKILTGHKGDGIMRR